MTRLILVCLLGACAPMLSSCGREEPIADTDLRILVEPETREVETGKPFRLRVTRIWRKDYDASPWDDAALSPLVTRLESQARREDARRIEETWTYLAYAFSLGDVKVPAVVFAARPRAGGNPWIVTAPAIELAVSPVLDPEAPGEPELFGRLRSERFAWTPWAIVLGVLVLAGAVWRLRRGAPTVAEGPADVPAVTPAERARARLADLDGDVVEAAAVLREYVQAHLGVRTREHTTEEVLEAAGIEALPGDAQEDLGAVLARADLAKFAAWEPEDDEGRGLVARALAFVERTGRAS